MVLFLRCGVLASKDLEEQYGDDISFILAQLKMLSESENVSKQILIFHHLHMLFPTMKVFCDVYLP